MKKRILTKTHLMVITLLLTICFGLFVNQAYACGPGQKPCGDICIPSNQKCNIGTGPVKPGPFLKSNDEVKETADYLGLFNTEDYLRFFSPDSCNIFGF